MNPDLSGAHWRKSSRSEGQGNCVEVASLGAIRDSKNQDGPVIRIDLPALVAAVKEGCLDLP